MTADAPAPDFETLRADPIVATIVTQAAALGAESPLPSRRESLLRAAGGPDALRELARRVAALGASPPPDAVPWLATLAQLDPLWELQRVAIEAIARIDRDAAARVASDAVDRAWQRNGRLWNRDEIIALIREDPSQAYDRLAVFLEPPGRATPRGGEVVAAVLGALGARLQDRDGAPVFCDPEVPSHVAADPRWLRLAAALRTNASQGARARGVLRDHDARLVDAALAATAMPALPAPAPDTRARGDLLTRYRRGDHERVWRELRAAGAIDGALRAEALAVARETMTRVAAACDLLVERLTARGWTVLPFMPAREPPCPDDARHLAALEQLTGAPLPVSLRAFWEVVGGVNLIWDFQAERHRPPLLPGVNLDQMDPLCVSPPAYCEEFIASWTEENAAFRPELRDPFVLDLAPDALHKAQVSGGSPHHIALPFAGADPTFEDRTFDLPFVEYLRHCVRYAGFPFLAILLEGYERARLPRDRGAHAMLLASAAAPREGIAAFVRELTRGIEPF